MTSSLVIGLTTLYLHETMVIGSQALPAPQATLMATLIKGLLAQNLPWGLVLVGVFITVTLELCGIHSLSFAVGSYLPISTTAPIFAGGVVRALVERATGKADGIRDQLRHALQLRLDRRRLARRHPLRHPLWPRHHPRRRGRRLGLSRSCTRARAARSSACRLPVAGCRALAGGPAQAGVTGAGMGKASSSCRRLSSRLATAWDGRSDPRRADAAADGRRHPQGGDGDRARPLPVLLPRPAGAGPRHGDRTPGPVPAGARRPHTCGSCPAAPASCRERRQGRRGHRHLRRRRPARSHRRPRHRRPRRPQPEGAEPRLAGPGRAARGDRRQRRRGRADERARRCAPSRSTRTLRRPGGHRHRAASAARTSTAICRKRAGTRDATTSCCSRRTRRSGSPAAAQGRRLRSQRRESRRHRPLAGSRRRGQGRARDGACSRRRHPARHGRRPRARPRRSCKVPITVPPPEVVFSAPTQGETDVDAGRQGPGPVLARPDAKTIKGGVAVAYTGVRRAAAGLHACATTQGAA